MITNTGEAMSGEFGNMTWFNIRRHSSAARRAASMQEKISSLRELISSPEAEKVRITFDGYDDDPRELCEIEEVRDWLQTVLFAVPGALALLDQETFVVAQGCCNKITMMQLDYPIPGRKRVEIEVSPEWLKAVHAVGLD